MMGKFHLPKIFKNRQFMRLWGNQLILQVAFNMCNYTALLILANRTHSPFVQAQLYAALTLPAFVFGIVAGPVVDMFDKKKIMIVSNFVIAALFFIYIFSTSNTALMMIIAFLTSSAARFFIPAEAATIPLVVSKESLEHANTFFLFTLMGSVLIGYSIAGPIIQFFGGLGTVGEIMPFVISGIFLALGSFPLFWLNKINFIKLSTSRRSILRSTFLLFNQTVKEVRKERGVSVPIGLLVFVEFIIGILSITLLEYVSKYLALPLTSISYVLMGPLILGLIIGVVFLAPIERRFDRNQTIFFACLSVGLVFLALGILPFWVKVSFIQLFTVVSAFLMGIAIVIISIQSRTILQLNAKAEMYGRIFSFLDIMIALVTPIPVLILGFLADKVSILAILSAIGIVTAGVLLFNIKLARKKYA